MNAVAGIAVLMALLVPLMLARFWKLRPRGAPAFSVISFWLCQAQWR
jgi:hypothetical protein